MNPAQQTEYRALLARDIGGWAENAKSRGDPWWEAIERIPDYFDALVELSRSPELEPDHRRIVHRVIKYLISPLDLLPEFIYGPDGFREDLALILMACDHLGNQLGRNVIDRCGLRADDPGLERVRKRMETDLEEDILRHLEILLSADAVAGDEDLMRDDIDAAQLTASADEVEPVANDHVMVFAGPGTGKTYRIETELESLLVKEGVPPDEILVTTFTNKAADELRVRIRDRLMRAGVVDADGVLQRLRISTIHAFCYSLIGEFHHHILFLKGTFAPMTEAQRILFLFRHGIGALKLKDIYPKWKAQMQAQSGWHPIDYFHFYSYVGDIYDFLSEDVMSGTEDMLRHRYLEIINNDEPKTVDEKIIHTYPRYWRLVQDEGYLDHSMVLAYAEALLDDPQVRRHVQTRYRHLLVDEYQDTNPIQDRIFRAVAGTTGRLLAVGDDDQSIYAFRGADVRNAVDFVKRWPGARTETLDENRRSTRALLEATQALIGHNKTREPKQLHTNNPDGEPPWSLSAPMDDLPERTAALLAQLKRQGAIERWGDVGFFFRGMTERVSEYREALEGAGVRATIVSDRRFLRRPVVSGLMGVLGMIAGPAEKITGRKRKHRPFFEALGTSDRDDMLDTVRGWHLRFNEGKYDTLLDLYYAILNDTRAIGRPEILGDLGRLSAFIAEAEPQISSPSLEKRLSWFLQYAEAAADGFDGPAAVPSDDAVQIMTIHKAKGLEFPVVVIADLLDGLIPAGYREDVRTRLRRELAGIEPWLDPLEEERRVLYVGMTRAERLIILATAPERPSVFLDEITTQRVEPARAARVRAFAPGAYGPKKRRDAPLHATHGQVYNYQFCPKRYLLETRHGFAGRVIEPLRAGQSLHRALEIFHRLVRDGARTPEDRLERIFQRSWVKPRSAKKAKAEEKRLYGVFKAYADWYDVGRETTRVVDVERPFYVAEREAVLTGKIDLLRERDDKLEIVEFKYHKNPMLPDYPKRQLEHYSLSCPSDQPALVVHYLQENLRDEFERTEPEVIRSELRDTFGRMRREEFEARPVEERCRLCPVRFACCDRTGA